MTPDAQVDRRRTALRDDLAAAALRGKITAPRYADPQQMAVSTPKTPLLRQPDGGLDTELLFGERFDVYDMADGWAWGQSVLDGYVGYIPSEDLGDQPDLPTHRVTTLSAQIYAEPKLKTRPRGSLPFSARVSVADTTDSHARIGEDAWIPLPQLCSLDQQADWVQIAEGFRGAPYIWGGRSSWGLDCSGLVQLSRQAAGHACPRDSDMQEAELGHAIGASDLGRGDLVFWKGHVGIMLDATTLLHANAHHMAVASEPLSRAVERIAAAGEGRPTRYTRVDADPPPT